MRCLRFHYMNYFLSQIHPVNAAGVATVMVLSLPQRHARMRRKLQQKQCRDEERMIAQLNYSLLADRP
ncbi:MAG TPA: hypothetical protein VMS25_10605 [Candidatus Limnocylindrales bacterium]|nr:hypothetical protein [Candidatus Limnocylindrales bacterium]